MFMGMRECEEVNSVVRLMEGENESGLVSVLALCSTSDVQSPRPCSRPCHVQASLTLSLQVSHVRSLVWMGICF